MAKPRATWKGHLQISLVSIPIKVYPATEASDGLSFNQLHADCQTRVQQKRWCPKCQRFLNADEIVKAFEFEKDRYVQVLEDEIDALKPPSTRVIDLVTFAAVSTLPLRAIDRAYFLAPDGPEHGPATEAYALLCEAMTGTVGIGQLAIYGREYLVAVGPLDGSLMLYTLHHAAELRTSPFVAVLQKHSDRTPEVGLLRQVLASLRGPLDLAAYEDAYQADVRRLIAAKIAGDEIVIPAVVDTAPVVNLRAALEQSLAAVSMSGSEKLRMAKAGLRARKRAV